MFDRQLEKLTDQISDIGHPTTTPSHQHSTTTTMPGKTLLILGSGPGIGVGVAKNFSVRGFTHVALVARNADRLKQDKDQVLDAIQERGYSCQVKTWPCDMVKGEDLKKVLKEIEGFGSLECVLYNAARVAGKPPLEESVESIRGDFEVSFARMWVCGKVLTTVVVDEHRTIRDGAVGDSDFAEGFW